MPLRGLQTFQFRNLQNVRISLDPGLQIIYGENASGKTSVLDAMHVLCSGKSFLGASPRKIQQFDTQNFSVNGEIEQENKFRQRLQFRWDDSRIQLTAGHESIRRSSEYAALQPVQAISPLSYKLIDDTPDIRRRFIDWGVFHVKHEYIGVWRRFQRSLSQRNAMLSDGVDALGMAAWSKEYIQLSELLDKFRAEYVEQLTLIVESMVRRFLPENSTTIKYHRGWDSAGDLGEILAENFNRDRERHFTYHGPQRAELAIRFDHKLAKDVASRGQKKLITFALYLAQATLQQKMGQHSGLLIVDDLPSELDTGHQAMLLNILQELPMQVVLSCIELQQLEIAEGMAKKLFHVKQGRVKEVVQ